MEESITSTIVPQDADGGKACAVALHAVDQGGNGHEMPLPVIEPGIPLQQAAQGHGAGDKQQIGGGDDHQHGGEEPGQGRQRLPDGHSQVVGRPQQQNAQQRRPNWPGAASPPTASLRMSWMAVERRTRSREDSRISR